MLEGMALPPEQLRPDTMPYQYLFQRQRATTPQASHKAVLVIFGHHIEVEELALVATPGRQRSPGSVEASPGSHWCVRQVREPI